MEITEVSISSFFKRCQPQRKNLCYYKVNARKRRTRPVRKLQNQIKDLCFNSGRRPTESRIRKTGSCCHHHQPLQKNPLLAGPNQKKTNHHFCRQTLHTLNRPACYYFCRLPGRQKLSRSAVFAILT